MFAAAALALLVTLALAVVRASLGPTVFDRAQAANTIGTAAMLLLAGCSRTTGTGAINECDFWRPISWSTKDTHETIAEVKANNARRGAWCKGSQ